jgi:hypothetical protein
MLTPGQAEQGRINQLKRLSQNLNECTELNEQQQLSENFGENLQGKKYYTLVRFPEGSQ